MRRARDRPAPGGRTCIAPGHTFVKGERWGSRNLDAIERISDLLGPGRLRIFGRCTDFGVCNLKTYPL